MWSQTPSTSMYVYWKNQASHTSRTPSTFPDWRIAFPKQHYPLNLTFVLDYIWQQRRLIIQSVELAAPELRWLRKPELRGIRSPADPRPCLCSLGCDVDRMSHTPASSPTTICVDVKQPWILWSRISFLLSIPMGLGLRKLVLDEALWSTPTPISLHNAKAPQVWEVKTRKKRSVKHIQWRWRESYIFYDFATAWHAWKMWNC